MTVYIFRIEDGLGFSAPCFNFSQCLPFWLKLLYRTL